MLKKKILLWLLVLWSCIAWITQARNINANVWESFTIWNDTAELKDDIGNVYSDEYWNVFWYETYESYYWTDVWFWWIFWNNWQLAYIYAQSSNPSYTILRALNYFSWYCEVNYTDNYIPDSSNNTLNWCSIQSIDNFYVNWLWWQINNIFWYKPDQYHWNDNWYICFWVQSIDKAYCFILPNDYSLQANWSNSCDSLWNYVPNDIWYDKWDCTQQHAVYYYNNKYNLWDFTDLYWESPFNWWWEDEPIITWYDPETWLPCATIDTIIKYETNYNTWICYSTPFTMSGNQIIQITPKSFTELRSWYNQFNNDLNKYRNYCTPPATSTACANAFQNEEEKRNLINKIPEWLNTKVVYDYCHMYLTYSGDTNICEIDDEELRSASYEDLINAMNEITITQPWTWSVFDNYKDQTARNIITALPSVYYKITSIFRNNTWVKWIIPSYITWIIILIVLFKLFKK